MKPITPVHYDDTSEAVSDLHKGLMFLFMYQHDISAHDRATLRERLAPDLKPDKFGQATLYLVKLYQEQLNNTPAFVKDHSSLVVNGDVDPNTADALNWLLRSLGAIH